MFAATIAATAIVVPKSASESMPLPVDDVAGPNDHVKYGMKNMITD